MTPAELRSVLRVNQRDGYAPLMQVAAEAIVELARDRRYVGLNDAGVTIRHKDRASSQWRTTRLTGHEFMRRFSAHMCCRRACTRCATTACGIPRAASRRPAPGSCFCSTSRRLRAVLSRRATWQMTQRLDHPQLARPKQRGSARAAMKVVSFRSAGSTRNRRVAHDLGSARPSPASIVRALLAPRPDIADRQLRHDVASPDRAIGPVIRRGNQHCSALRATPPRPTDWQPHHRRPGEHLKTPLAPAGCPATSPPAFSPTRSMRRPRATQTCVPYGQIR